MEQTTTQDAGEKTGDVQLAAVTVSWKWLPKVYKSGKKKGQTHPLAGYAELYINDGVFRTYRPKLIAVEKGSGNFGLDAFTEAGNAAQRARAIGDKIRAWVERNLVGQHPDWPESLIFRWENVVSRRVTEVDGQTTVEIPVSELDLGRAA